MCRTLPLPAHARPALIAFLRERGLVTRGAPRRHCRRVRRRRAKPI